MENNSESEKNLNSIVENTLLSLKKVLNSNISTGEVIKIGNNGFVIPFLKLSVGCLTGGAQFNINNKNKKNEVPFSGGNGTGFNITPIGMLCVIDGKTEYVNCNQETSLNQDIVNVVSKSLAKILNSNDEVW